MLYIIRLWIQDVSPRFRGWLVRQFFGGSRISIGREFKLEKGTTITVRRGAHLTIGSHVEIRRDVEFRITGTARIEIGNNVRIDRGIRIIATNDAVVKIGDGTRIGLHTVLNAGDSITLGNKVLVSGFVYLQTSMHRHEYGKAVQDQGYDHAPIVLDSDVWVGAHAIILPGVCLGAGSIVGSTAVVTKDTSPGQIVAGVPAKPLHSRLEANRCSE